MSSRRSVCRMLRTPSVLLALAFTLSACGSGTASDGGNDSSGGSAKSAEDVAALAKCSATFKNTGSDKMMFSTDGGTCDVGGTDVTISWFNATKARDNYREMGDSMGGGDPIVYGENWAIECTDLEPCKTVAKRTGGELD